MQDTAAITNTPEPPATTGMTTKVVKGSIWTLAGHIAPLGVSLITTPFVIRMLGTETYGVLVLVILIPSYLGFADFGMGIASTKLASEAYSDGEVEKEGRIVRTAALIALFVTLPFAVATMLLSDRLVYLFNVPEIHLAEASLALKIASVTLIVNFINGILNTPQLARLRMDLNTLVTSGFRIAGIVGTPIVIYLGFGIVGVVVVLLLASSLVLVGHIYIACRLDRRLRGFRIDRTMVRPLIGVGGGFAISAVAGVFLLNLEKAVLAKIVSVEALAFYSVAFTLATMTTMFSTSMTQSLIPAFSQLLVPASQEHLKSLFLRGLRMNFILILPLLVTLISFARPLFTIWAGEPFGENSTHLFYILTAGLLANLMAHVPYSLVIATGRTDILAKVHWIELFPYLAALIVLTWILGPVGAALAWTLRVVADAVILSILLKRVTDIQFDFVGTNRKSYLILVGVILMPVVVTVAADGRGIWPIIAAGICVPIYLLFTTICLLDPAERSWLSERFSPALNGFRT